MEKPQKVFLFFLFLTRKIKSFYFGSHSNCNSAWNETLLADLKGDHRRNIPVNDGDILPCGSGKEMSFKEIVDGRTTNRQTDNRLPMEIKAHISTIWLRCANKKLFPLVTLQIESHICDHELLDLLNLLRQASQFITFRNEFNQFNKTLALL